MLTIFGIRQTLLNHQKRLQFGDNLQTITEIANRAGVHRDTVYACINGDRINERTQYALSRALEDIEIENQGKSKTKIIVFFSLNEKTVAILIEQNVFPSPLIEEVSIIVLEPSMLCFLYKNCNEERIALKDSDNADFGRSKTAKLLSECFIPTIPINGN